MPRLFQTNTRHYEAVEALVFPHYSENHNA